MKKAASNDEFFLTLDEVLMLAESLHKGASSMAEMACKMMRRKGSSTTIPMSDIKSMVKNSLDLSIHNFVEELHEVRSGALKKPAIRKKAGSKEKKK